MQVHPKRMQWIIKRLTWVGGGFVILLLVIIAIRYRNQSRIDAVQIDIEANNDELKFTQPDDIRSLLIKNFGNALEGQALGKVNAESIEKALKDNEFIKDANVYVDALNKVHISVSQREPMVRVMDVSDPSYYLDINGKRIPTSDKFTARVLVITGDIGIFAENYQELETSRLRKVFNLAKYVHNDPFLKAQIEQIHIDHVGEVTLVPKLGDHLIHFGYPDEDVEAKFKHLEIFYKEGLAREGWDKYRSISIAYKNQVVAKKR